MYTYEFLHLFLHIHTPLFAAEMAVCQHKQVCFRRGAVAHRYAGRAVAVADKQRLGGFIIPASL